MLSRKKIENYLDRDVSWMYFNSRILQEANRPQIPLLERIAFLGIYSNNLDEFFRVRMAYESRIAEASKKSRSGESQNAQKIIKKISELNAVYAQNFDRCVHQLREELRSENICIVNDAELTELQLQFVNNYFKEKLNGLISPIWFSAIKMFDVETDENIYLAVRMKKKDTDESFEYAYIEIPVRLCGRFVRLPDADGKCYIMYVDDVIRSCLSLVFEGLGFTVFEAYAFKFTRDAEMEFDNDLRNGKIQKIAKGIKSRKSGEPLRVIYDREMPKDLLNRVLKKLDLNHWDTLQKSGRYQNHKDLMKFPDCGRQDLKYPVWSPIMKKELCGKNSLIETIQHQDCFLHVPYHNFDSYIRVLQEAAINKNVKDIKITLYRLANESKVIKALIAAARNGKKVTVIIELLARFDEESNIKWSKTLQDAGIKVKFGVEGLKVHSKITCITMKTGPNIACISTGNFHEGNARMYTDCILMTGNKKIVSDVLNVFKFIEYPYAPIHFKELLVSPNEMKSKFIKLIDSEIENSKLGRNAYIKIKINHITDPDIISKLYDASRAGVDIRILVRGNCSLIPGVKGISDNIKLVGIIDRYLEHSRIFVFCNDNKEKVFMGSADWMPRNLDNRIEVITPVYDEAIKKELVKIVDYGLQDNVSGRIVDGKGKNDYNPGISSAPFRSQEALYNDYLSENI